MMKFTTPVAMETKKIDIPNLNKEAKLNAIKHVCNVLQRSHQLEKVDQHKKRILRKNVSAISFAQVTKETKIKMESNS